MMDALACAQFSRSAGALSDNVFFDPAILEPALTFLAPADARQIAVQGPDGGWQASWPIARAHGRYGPLPTPVPLSVWHHAYSMLGTPLHNSPEALGDLFDATARHSAGTQVLLLRHMRTDDAFWPCLLHVLMQTGRRFQIIAQLERAGIKLENVYGLDMRAITGKRTVQSARVSLRKLAEHGEPGHRAVTEKQALGPALETFLRLEASGWKGRAGTALSAASHDGFMRAAIANLAGRDSARIDLTLLDERVIAATLSIASGPAHQPLWMPWKTAYDEAFTGCGPGALNLFTMTQLLLQEAQENGTGLALDSLADPQSMIANRLWRHRWQLADVLIDLKPGGSASFPLIALAERGRLVARQAARTLRARLRNR